MLDPLVGHSFNHQGFENEEGKNSRKCVAANGDPENIDPGGSELYQQCRSPAGKDRSKTFSCVLDSS